MTHRLCHDCGATDAEATYTGARRPRGRVDRCISCTEDPVSAQLQRLCMARRELAKLRGLKAAKGQRYRAPKPIWSAPLFRELRP